MKKSLILAALAMAATALGAQAKTADQLRVYINPGHGSWTPDDRPNTLVGYGDYSRTGTDTLAFFESNTNLRKGLGVLETLVQYGLKFDRSLNQTGERWQIGAARDLSNNIVMSHVKCGPYHDDNGTAKQLGDNAPFDIAYYNRNLSEISAEVQANNFDMFISIHSNAATEGTTTNFPLFLYRGWDTPQDGTGFTAEQQVLSRDMASKAWGYSFENPHAQWTSYSATNQNLRGDINFYGSSSTTGSLGVLKHNTPGYLVEGYFHTYQPARHRAMNWDVDYVEGYAYARGVADYFGLTPLKTGKIYGIVRDKNEKFSDAAYKPNPTTLDAYLPLNGVKVLLKKDGVTVAEKTTDNYYNGAFVFLDVEPGTYTLEFEHEQYNAPADPVTVTVTASKVAYPTVQLVNKDWVPPTVVYENYPDIVVPGTLAADDYTFTQAYTDEALAPLEGLKVRRTLARDNKVYILAHDATMQPTILVYDGKEKNLLATVSTQGTQGTVTPVADIQLTAEGRLVATNENLNHYDNSQVQAGETRGVNYIYVWDNDEQGVPTGQPKVLGSSTLSGNFYRAYVGHTMAYSGTLTEGKIIVPAYTASTTATTHKFFYNIYTVVAGNIASTQFNNKGIDAMGLEAMGQDVLFTTAPTDPDSFIATGSAGRTAQYQFGNVTTPVQMSADLGQGLSQPSFFRYNNTVYMAVADKVAGSDLGVKLLDITAGLDKATHVSTTNTTLAEATDGLATSCLVPVLDADENITAAHMNLYSVRQGKLNRLTTEGVTVKAVGRPLAYALNSTEENGIYTINFKTSMAVPDAKVILTPTDPAKEAITLNLGALDKGANSVQITKTELEAGTEYTWAVQLTGKTNPQNGKVKAKTNSLAVRGGAVPMTDPSYPASFGRTIVAHGKVNGFDIYDADGTLLHDKIHFQHTGVASTFTNASDPFRGSEHQGQAYFPCWGDKAYGVIEVNPADADQAPATIFSGTNNGTGCHLFNDIKLGGGCSGAAIVGDGDNMRLFTHSEDHEGLNGKGTSENSIVMYNLTADKKVESAPIVLPNNGYKAMLANGQADIVPYGDGIFVVQNRGAGNNSTGCPSFIYIDATTHEILYNSGTLKDELAGGGKAIAISHDGSEAAVAQDKALLFFDVTWNGNKPTFTYRTQLSAGLANYTHLRYDYAGNVHAYVPSNGYHVWNTAVKSPVVTTPAIADYALKGASGIEDITMGQTPADAPAVYYNMQGIRMQGTLTPGIYLRHQGGKTQKVVIK